MNDIQLSQTILEQMGGRLRHMVGAYNFVAIERGVQFSFKMCRKTNKCVVKLNWMDTYDVEFWLLRGDLCKRVSRHENIYCDQLIDVFEEETGLVLL